VARRIGAKPVSSSRTTAFATKAVITKMPKRFMIPTVWSRAKGEFLNTCPTLPIWIWSIVLAAKVSRKKIA
jgi:hypothetical protein